MYKPKAKCPHCKRIFKGHQGLSAHLRHNHLDSGAVTAKQKNPVTLETAIAEIEEEITDLGVRQAVLHDALDSLIGAQDIITSRSRNASAKS